MPAAGGTDLKSGKFGKVTFGASDVMQVMDWTLEIKSTSEKFATSNTGGWKTSRQGVLDSSGSFRFKLEHDAADSIHNKIPYDDADGMGLEGDLELFLDTTPGSKYTVPAIVHFSIDVDINDGNVTGGTATFEGTGPVTHNL
jgi:hypothetical protein